MKRFFLALRFLTVFPVGGDGEVTAEDLVGSTLYYPVVGLLVGLVLYGFWLWASSLWPVFLTAALTVTLWELISAGLHLDGLMDTCDGLGVRGNLERRLEVMKDSHVGAFGAQAAIFAMLLKVMAVAALSNDVAYYPLLILAPLTGRSVMVTLMSTCKYARASGGLGKVFVDSTGTRQLLVTLFLYGLMGYIIIGWKIMLVTLALAIFFSIFRFFFNHNFGGITGDILGAICELHELAVLIIAPLLLR
ncbi:MAG: adenosylcobinamide-GDP ribazoletransferase [Firmicutes bacterium]|nr:adenosylcobinamide-GDP ribazoletransferase [Bacillota bacterium]